LLRAVVFDFDGVIANSEPLHYDAFRHILAGEGIDLAKEDYYGLYLGYDDAGVFAAVGRDRGAAWATAKVTALVAAKARHLEQLEADGSILFPGADAAIRRLAAAVPLAIASGALGVEIRRVLDRAALTGYFAAIVAAGDTTAGKPSPDPYLRALALVGEATGQPLRAADCVAVEDSPWGLQSARAAGLHTVAVAHTYDHAALDAELVISSLDELDYASVQTLCGD
jgi:beta-phosphoglucomutase-like phosphatase (HAD superfamily)